MKASVFIGLIIFLLFCSQKKEENIADPALKSADDISGMKNKVTGRFLWYVTFDTRSDFKSELMPTTAGQKVFARELAKELIRIGLSDVDLDSSCIIMATVPANTDKPLPVIGLLAHLDTSPEFNGSNITPRIVRSYLGGDIILDAQNNIVLSSAVFPEIQKYKGQDLIVTNGKTLLGADDKAGIAEIVTAMEYLLSHPEIKHGKIRIAFTPDEETGKGMEHFDVKKFGADFAYTMDGDEIGTLNYENFNMAAAKIMIHGTSVHPGFAKDKMKNSIMIAGLYFSMLPQNETPGKTEGVEGYYNLREITGNMEQTLIKLGVCDFDKGKFSDRKDTLKKITGKLNTQFGPGTVEIELKDLFFNMGEKIDKASNVMDIARKAITNAGMTPQVVPLRAGTDGATLSYMGLPCPNIFEGGHNFHGKYEFIPIESMEKACQVIVEIAKIAAEKNQNE